MKKNVIVRQYKHKEINPCCAEPRIFLATLVNTIAVDALAPGVARSSTGMALAMWDGQDFVSLALTSISTAYQYTSRNELK